MACGCALCATDIGGVGDYAIHEQTALLSPPKDPDALARNIAWLLEDNNLRVRLARQGQNLIANSFTWDRATDHLERVLVEHSKA